MSVNKLLSLKKLFSPSHHLWIRPSRLVQNGSAMLVEMGLTEHGFSFMGDVISAECHLRKANDQVVVRAGENLLTLHWEGYKQTAADELYHTVWESVEGKTPIAALVSGELHSVFEASTIKEELDEGTVLAKIVCSSEDFESASDEWMDESQYIATLRKEVPGAFCESA